MPSRRRVSTMRHWRNCLRCLPTGPAAVRGSGSIRRGSGGSRSSGMYVRLWARTSVPSAPSCSTSRTVRIGPWHGIRIAPSRSRSVATRMASGMDRQAGAGACRAPRVAAGADADRALLPRPGGCRQRAVAGPTGVASLGPHSRSCDRRRRCALWGNQVSCRRRISLALSYADPPRLGPIPARAASTGLADRSVGGRLARRLALER